jgi:hypothetical protein
MLRFRTMQPLANSFPLAHRSILRFLSGVSQFPSPPLGYLVQFFQSLRLFLAGLRLLAARLVAIQFLGFFSLLRIIPRVFRRLSLPLFAFSVPLLSPFSPSFRRTSASSVRRLVFVVAGSRYVLYALCILSFRGLPCELGSRITNTCKSSCPLHSRHRLRLRRYTLVHNNRPGFALVKHE